VPSWAMASQGRDGHEVDGMRISFAWGPQRILPVAIANNLKDEADSAPHEFAYVLFFGCRQ